MGPQETEEAENSVNRAVSVWLIIHPSVPREIRMFSQEISVSLELLRGQVVST